jgi:acetylornithine deacetylase/succinyl-diaminopimelate desuccinylase-like protein
LALDVRHPDLHSGSFGGAVRNAVEELCRLIASLHAPDGRVAIAGFYDALRSPEPRVRDELSRVGPSDRELLLSARAASGFGEPGYSLFERATIRPALTVTGIHGGYTGPGSKSVIAGRARSRLSFRLVADQRPDEVERLLARHVHAMTSPTVRVTATRGKGSPPFALDVGHPAAQAAGRALRRAFGRDPVVIPSGGSISIIPELRRAFAAPVVLMGFALPDDHQHGPDEHFHLPTFWRAITACTVYLDELARGLVARKGTNATIGAGAW